MKAIETKEYHVTGVTRDGKRFKRIYGAENARYAFGINLWRGSVWRVPTIGKRQLVKRVWN
jgi:hypothetical protein